jgi:membrane protease subunit (stomatin/prohibitin family)
MPKVIQWVGYSGDDVVWRYPSSEISWGDALIVEEHQAAVFFRDGKVYDVFRAGRHILTTANLPLITSILSKIAGFDKVPFKATVIFISLKQLQGRFGAKSQTVELAPIKFFGSFWFRVEEPNLFVQEVVGGQNIYTTSQLQDFLRGYFNERIIDTLSQYSLAQVYGKLDETSFLAKNTLQEAFRRIGLELIDVKFEGIDTEPEWRDRIFYLRTGVSAADMLRMETVKESAKAVSQAPGAGAGAGIGVGMILPMMMQPTAQQPAAMQPCPKCGFNNPPNAKFCMNCGSQIVAGGIQCPKCGFNNPPNAKFCAGCGTPLQIGKCPKCGAQITPGAKFCPSCGQQLT